MRKFFEEAVLIIIEMVEDMNIVNLEVEYIEGDIKSEDEIHSSVEWYDENGKMMKYYMQLVTNSYEINNNKETFKSWKSRFETFIKGNGLEFNKQTSSLMLILHEFGHVYGIELMIDNDIFMKYVLLRNISINSLSLAFNDDEDNKYKKEGINPAILFNFSELYADNFALAYFIPVYNKLKERGLI